MGFVVALIMIGVVVIIPVLLYSADQQEIKRTHLVVNLKAQNQMILDPSSQTGMVSQKVIGMGFLIQKTFQK